MAETRAQPGGGAATVCGQTREGAGPSVGAAPPSFLIQWLCTAALPHTVSACKAEKIPGPLRGRGHLAEPRSLPPAALAQSQCISAVTLAPARPANYAAALLASANGSAWTAGSGRASGGCYPWGCAAARGVTAEVVESRTQSGRASSEGDSAALRCNGRGGPWWGEGEGNGAVSAVAAVRVARAGPVRAEVGRSLSRPSPWSRAGRQAGLGGGFAPSPGDLGGPESPPWVPLYSVPSGSPILAAQAQGRLAPHRSRLEQFGGLPPGKGGVPLVSVSVR